MKSFEGLELEKSVNENRNTFIVEVLGDNIYSDDHVVNIIEECDIKNFIPIIKNILNGVFTFWDGKSAWEEATETDIEYCNDLLPFDENGYKLSIYKFNYIDSDGLMYDVKIK